MSWLTRRLPLPWRIERLPRWIPVALGAAFLLLAFLKFFTPNYLCAGPRPFGRINAIMLVVELICGYLLIRHVPLRRAISAVMGATLIGAAIFLTRMHLRGADVRGCDCFGPIDLSYGWHLVVIAVLVFACGVVFLHEETRRDRAAGVQVKEVSTRRPEP